MPTPQTTDWVQEAIAEAHADLGKEVTERKALVAELIDAVADGIRVLRTRDGVNVSDDACTERARNIVGGLIHNYEIRRLK